MLARGTERSASLRHHVELRGLNPATAYELVVADGAEQATLPFVTEGVRWVQGPRFSILRDRLLVEWKASGVNEVRWTFIQKGGRGEHGVCRAEGRLVRRFRAPISQDFPVSWTFSAEGLESLSGTCTGAMGCRHLDLKGKAMRRFADARLRPVFVGDDVVWVDRAGRMNVLHRSRCLGTGVSMLSDWSSREGPGDLAEDRPFAQPVPEVDGKGFLVYRLGGKERKGELLRCAVVSEGGRRRCVVRDRVTVAADGPERHLASLLDGTRFHQLLTTAGCRIVRLHTFELGASRAVSSRDLVLGELVEAAVDPVSGRPFAFVQKRVAHGMPLPPVVFDGGMWLCSRVAWGRGRRRDLVWFVWEIPLAAGDDVPPNVHAAFRSDAPSAGPSVVGDRLWITAGMELLTKRRGEATTRLGLHPDEGLPPRIVSTMSLVGPVYECEGRAVALVGDSWGDAPNVAHVIAFRAMQKIDLRRLELSERSGEWRVAARLSSAETYLVRVAGGEGGFARAGSTNLVGLSRSFILDRKGAMKVHDDSELVHAQVALADFPDRTILAYVTQDGTLRLCDLRLLAMDAAPGTPCPFEIRRASR